MNIKKIKKQVGTEMADAATQAQGELQELSAGRYIEVNACKTSLGNEAFDKFIIGVSPHESRFKRFFDTSGLKLDMFERWHCDNNVEQMKNRLIEGAKKLIKSCN